MPRRVNTIGGSAFLTVGFDGAMMINLVVLVRLLLCLGSVARCCVERKVWTCSMMIKDVEFIRGRNEKRPSYSPGASYHKCQWEGF